MSRMGELREFASEIWEVTKLRARGGAVKSRKRLLDPDNKQVRLPIRTIIVWSVSPKHRTRFFLGAQSSNHVRILLGAASILASRGYRCTFIDLDLNRKPVQLPRSWRCLVSSQPIFPLLLPNFVGATLSRPALRESGCSQNGSFA